MSRTGSMYLGPFICFLLLLAASQNASSETAEEVYKKAKAAHEKFLSSFKDVTMDQEMAFPGESVGHRTSRKKMHKGKKFRTETRISGAVGSGEAATPAMTTVAIYDGKDMWMVSPFAGKRRLDKEESKAYGAQMHWTDLVGGGLALVGKETIAGRRAFVIEPKGAKGLEDGLLPFTKLWIDAKSYHMLKGAYSSPDGNVVMHSSDFRKISGGFEWPHQLEVSVNGKLQSRITTKSIKVNSGLSDDLFDPSKLKAEGPSLQELMMQQMQGD